MKKLKVFYLLSLISSGIFFLLQFYDPPLLRDNVEAKTFDLRLHLRHRLRQQPLDPSIVIIAIDEHSLATIGRWPWSRTVMADLVDRISAAGPRAVGIDIMFSEPEGKEADARLAEALRNNGKVVLATAFFLEADRSGKPVNPPDFLWDSAFMEVKPTPGIDWKKWRVSASAVNPPIAELAAGTVLANVTTPADLDGVVRNEILSLTLGDDAYASLPLQVARIARKIPLKDMVLYGGSGVRLGASTIPTDLLGRAVINYRGPENSFPYISAADLLQGKVAPEALRDKIVLVGTSALATYDQKATPLSASMPGIEKNANVVQNILLNNFIQRAPRVVELAALLTTALLLVLVLPRLTPLQGVVAGFGGIGLYLIGAAYLLIDRNLWISVVCPVANMGFIVTVETVTKLITEERRAREIKRMFSSYVSPKIVDALIANPEMAALGGKRREVTILFSDMIGFTALSEKLPPEEVVSILNDYYRELAGIVFRWDGTLDKIVGDEIMAVWGAPTDQPDHAELAVRCALHMMDRMVALQDEWRAAGKPVVDCGIGINTGDVVAGNIGLAGKKMDYTVIGNHVNVAARVEKLTRNYGVKTIITGNTLEAIDGALKAGRFGHVEIVELDTVKVKGKEEEVRLFSLSSLKSSEFDEEFADILSATSEEQATS